jgi:hypothetical protein
MSSFKKLSRQDVTYVPYTANKRWVITSSSLSISGSFSVYAGTNITGTFQPSNSLIDPKSNGQYERLIYSTINHMFYQAFSGSLNTQSLMFNVGTYLSASEQRPTGSYFIYDTNPNQIKNFPTGTNQKIRVLTVNQDVYGSQILPYSFVASSSNSIIKDDGNGNLLTGSVYIGNIFYPQGIAVITSQNYLGLFPTASNSPAFTLTFQNEHIVYENEVRCIVKESNFNLSYNPSLTTNYASGSLRNFATGSDFSPYATAVGLYNDNNELLVVAKFGKPILISPNTDMTFVVKYDT